MWHQKKDNIGNYKWKFSCEVVRDELVQMAASEDADPKIVGWVKERTENHGTDIKDWPNPGCGARFKPCKCGPSQVVVDIHKPNGEWTACAAVRMPNDLDDAIKGHMLALHKAAGLMSP